MATWAMRPVEAGTRTRAQSSEAAFEKEVSTGSQGVKLLGAAACEVLCCGEDLSRVVCEQICLQGEKRSAMPSWLERTAVCT